jgi:hypothetical protein
VKRGIENGEIPASVLPSLFLDCLSGAIINHSLATELYEGQRALKSNKQFIDELVDYLLH